MKLNQGPRTNSASGDNDFADCPASTDALADGVIDLTQLRCPMLLLEFKLLLETIPGAGRLEVLASDREGVEDCRKFALKSGFDCAVKCLGQCYSIVIARS